MLLSDEERYKTDFVIVMGEIGQSNMGGGGRGEHQENEKISQIFWRERVDSFNIVQYLKKSAIVIRTPFLNS
jgi:hypothetical protein